MRGVLRWFAAQFTWPAALLGVGTATSFLGCVNAHEAEIWKGLPITTKMGNFKRCGLVQVYRAVTREHFGFGDMVG